MNLGYIECIGNSSIMVTEQQDGIASHCTMGGYWVAHAWPGAVCEDESGTTD